MRGSIYLKTLQDLQGQMMAWCAGMILLAAANVLLYPSVQNFPGLISFLENMPPAFKAMIGDVRTMAQLEGFLRVKAFDPLPLLLSIFSVSQGAALIAGEIETKSFDLLLARPIARWRIALGKFFALITASVAMVLALALGLIVSSHFVETEVTPGYLLLSALNGLPLTWLFGAVAMLGSCLLPRARHAAMAAGGFVIACYVFETLRQLSPSLRHLDKISLFAWQKAGWTLAGQIHPGPILGLLGLTAVLVAGAALALERKDLVS